MSDITAALKQLAAGKVSIDEVAEKFAGRDWPKGNPPTSLAEAAQRMTGDPEPFTPGSWDEVSAAYVTGLITDEQYKRLYEAVSKSA